MARRHLSLKTKLAAALLQCREEDGSFCVEWKHARIMSADQIISLFHFDHYPIRHEAGGPDEPWNLTPRLIPEHRKKTAKIDVPQIAKIKRITKKEEEFRARLLAKVFSDPEPETWGKKPRRPWPKRKMAQRSSH
jgi:hypothetical protein